MGRLLQAVVLLVGIAGVANAGPATRKYRIETTPPGASVYIDDLGNGAACEGTPCTIDVPLNATTLIIQLEKYEPELMPIEVTKGKRPVPISVKLKAAVGLLVVDAPKGATVKVNDEPKGKVGSVPLEIEVPAEPASVVITYNGKSQTELVDIVHGSQVEVSFKGGDGGSTSVADADDDDEDDDGDSGGGDDDSGDEGDGPSDGGEVTGSARPTTRQPMAQAGLAFDVGFRRFAFSDGSQPFNNNGEVVLGPAVELWPGRLLGVKPLRGLSLFAKVQFSISHQKVTRQSMGMETDVGASTFWGALEISLRQKFIVGSAFGIEASVGYVRDQVEFSADNQTVLDMVPSADYRSLRAGVRLSYVSTFEPYVGGEYRSVLSGGNLATRADASDTAGFRVGAGVRTTLGPLGARAEFSYARYTWAFASSGGTVPSGASDTIMWLGVIAGYDF